MLTRLGSGVLAIDVLRGTCRHDLRWIAPLTMVGRLRARLREALAREKASAASIQKAELDVRVEISEQSGLRGQDTVWLGAGNVFIGCRLAMRCQVVTGDGSSAVSLDAWQEWPRDWVER